LVDKSLTPRENDLLGHVFRFINEHHGDEYPDNSWLGLQMHISDSGVCNLKRHLQEKGYLRRESILAVPTEIAEQYLADLPSVVPVYIPVWGEVSAGKRRPDDVAVYMSHVSNEAAEDVPAIVIPDVSTRSESRVFALRVIGNSMENENIFAGDYVIVQQYQGSEWPREGEMIVTRYLPYYAEQDDEDDWMDYSDITDESLEGPVVKYLRDVEEVKGLQDVEEVKGRRIYCLGWRKTNGQRDSIIKTHVLLPIGRVLGVYRDIRR
jgi:SOS-response transcriptional repressor LexA